MEGAAANTCGTADCCQGLGCCLSGAKKHSQKLSAQQRRQWRQSPFQSGAGNEKGTEDRRGTAHHRALKLWTVLKNTYIDIHIYTHSNWDIQIYFLAGHVKELMTEWIEATAFNYRQRNARQHSTALDVPRQRLLREPALLKAIACWLAWAETLRKHATNDSRLTEARNLCRFIPDEGLSRAA